MWWFITYWITPHSPHHREKSCFHSFKTPTKHAFIVDVLDAEPEARWEGADQDVEVKEEGHPRRRLVLRHRRYDGDVDLSVAACRNKGGGEKSEGGKRRNSCRAECFGSVETNYTIDPPD